MFELGYEYSTKERTRENIIRVIFRICLNIKIKISIYILFDIIHIEIYTLSILLRSYPTRT